MKVHRLVDKLLNRESPYVRLSRLLRNFVSELNLQEGHFFGDPLPIRLGNILMRPIVSAGLTSVKEVRHKRYEESFLGDFFDEKRGNKGKDRLRTILAPVLTNVEKRNDYIKFVQLEFDYNLFQGLMDLCNGHPDMRVRRGNFTPSRDVDYVQIWQDSLGLMIRSVDKFGLDVILGIDILADYRRILEQFKRSDPESIINLTQKLVAFKTYGERNLKPEKTFYGASVFNGFNATMDFLHKIHTLFVGRHGVINTSTSSKAIDD